ncbi:unnamed protein product [Urochloa decumbens]|uniref:Strictosidine synthase conserved region domain-containing protein n=1 Tax=Urochloa decumbens TaxID=240449 RepID=A0ABC8WWA4_9POAL
MAAGLVFLKAVALALAPVVLPVALYNPRDFSPAPMPPEYSYGSVVSAPRHEARALARSERVGEGRLPGPDPRGPRVRRRRRVAVHRLRRLVGPEGQRARQRRRGLGPHRRPPSWRRARGGWRTHRGRRGHLMLDSWQGLLKVSSQRKVQPLTDAAEGVKFALTDGVDVAADGTIYFTDASYKYNLANHMADVLKARPHGRLMSFDPSTGRTAVLVRDLYVANGVAVTPDQSSLIYCETVMRRCSRYHITGNKKSTVEKFIENLPGFPDNIRYDGEGRYWIALSAGRTLQWDLLMKYPFVRKLVYLVDKFVAVPHGLKNSGAMSVTLDGEPVSMYTDPALAVATAQGRQVSVLRVTDGDIPQQNRPH